MFKSNWLLCLLVLFYVAVTVATSVEKRGSDKGDCDDKEEKSTTIVKPKPTRTRTTTRLTKTSTRPTNTRSKSTAADTHHCPTCLDSSCNHKCQDKICKHECIDGPCSSPCPFIQPPRYEPNVIAMAILLMVIGVFLMFMGFPFFIVTMALTGLLVGTCVAWVVLHAAEPERGYASPSTVYLGCSLGVGGLFAVASLFCWKATVYLLCGGAGYLLSVYTWSWQENFVLSSILARNIIGLGMVLVFLLGFVFCEFVTVILSTSFMGAYIFILGLDFFLQTGFLIGFKNLLDFDRHLIHGNDHVYVDAAIEDPKNSLNHYARYTIDTDVNGMLCAVLGLWILSTLWQRYYNRGRRFGLRVLINSNDSLKEKFEKGQTKKVQKQK